MGYMTDNEAKKYRHLLDRKKKALSLPEEQRKQFASEYEKIDKSTRGKITNYAYHIIRWGLTSEDEEKVCILLDMPSLWDKLLDLEEAGEGEKIDTLLIGMKALYDSLNKIT